MLAWVHTSLASEREFLVALFGEESEAAALSADASGSMENGAPAALHGAGGSGGALAAADGSGSVGVPTIPQLLDTVFESICRPLKVCLLCACVCAGGGRAWRAARNAPGGRLLPGHAAALAPSALQRSLRDPLKPHLPPLNAPPSPHPPPPPPRPTPYASLPPPRRPPAGPH